MTGFAAVIADLLKAGAKMNKISTGGFTPLFMATQGGHMAAVSVLVGAGAEIDIFERRAVGACRCMLPRLLDTRGCWRCLYRQGGMSTVRGISL